LRAKPSVRRSFAYCVLPLARLKAFGKEHDATVNDVLLTVLDLAMNRYLVERGRKLTDPPLVADMPVALGSGEGGGNSIAVLQFPLGAAATNARERLAQVMRRTADLKEHVRRTDASALMIYTAAVHGIPALMEALRVPRAPMLATSVISNPFGMPQRLYLGGAELEMVLPVSMLAPGQSLNITAVTYDQGLQIGFLGLAAELPDIQKLADCTITAFDELMTSNQLSTRRRRRPAPPRKATAAATERR
jgi:diacylglycerol O-acyltransferase